MPKTLPTLLEQELIRACAEGRLSCDSVHQFAETENGGCLPLRATDVLPPSALLDLDSAGLESTCLRVRPRASEIRVSRRNVGFDDQFHQQPNPAAAIGGEAALLAKLGFEDGDRGGPASLRLGDHGVGAGDPLDRNGEEHQAEQHRQNRQPPTREQATRQTRFHRNFRACDGHTLPLCPSPSAARAVGRGRTTTPTHTRHEKYGRGTPHQGSGIFSLGLRTNTCARGCNLADFQGFADRGNPIADV